MTEKRKRHCWPEAATRRSQYYTIRKCPICGLERVTDHNEAIAKTYYRDAIGVVSPMPECELVE